MKFIAKSGDGEVEYDIKEGVNLIGRDESCDIVINSNHISRNHISCVVSRDRIVIQDLNSRNGTFVNGLRVKNTVEIKDGDVISLGKYTMAFVTGEPEGTAPAPTPVSVVPEGEQGEIENGEPYKGETLPLKGDMARRVDQGGEQSNLPAKFDPSRYSISSQDSKVVVRDKQSGEAIELYRGSPDAALLDSILSERRATQRRNTILAIAGGAAVLIAVLVVAFALGGSDNQTRTNKTPRVDEQKYFEGINAAVVKFDDNKPAEALKIIDKLREMTKGNRRFELHEQMRSLFNLFIESKGDIRTMKRTEALMELSEIDMQDIPRGFKTGELRTWINAKKIAIGKYDSEKNSWERAQEFKVANKSDDAVKILRRLQSGVYFKEQAQNLIAEIHRDQVFMILGQHPEGLDIDDITPENARDMVKKLPTILDEHLIPDGEPRQKLMDYYNACIDKIYVEKSKRDAILTAEGQYEEDDYLGAWKTIEDEGLLAEAENDPVLAALINRIRTAKKLVAGFEQAKIKYDEGNAAEALKILERQGKDISIYSWHGKFLDMKNKIDDVLKWDNAAGKALELDDVLEAKRLYNELLQTENNTNNFYNKKAADWVNKFDEDLENDPESFAKAYERRAEGYIDRQEYLKAREFAEKATRADDDMKYGENIFNNLSAIGKRLMNDAYKLEKAGKLKEALKLLIYIRNNRLYKKADGVEAIVLGRIRRLRPLVNK